jgi:hypothetical protein
VTGALPKRWFTACIALVGVSLLACSPEQSVQRAPTKAERRPPERAPKPVAAESDDILRRAFEQRARDLKVDGRGVVSRVLPDDRDGSRHQRFILRLGSGQTVLVAHNIDIAQRVPALRTGDEVAFRGEYEWSSQGGVIHWTHDDPAGRHSAGWLKHKGRTYR